MSRTLRLVAIAATALAVLTGTVTAQAAPAAESAAAAPAKRRTAEVPTICSPTEMTPNAFPRARYVWGQLRTAGYSAAATAGVIAVLDHRSALAPMAISPGGYLFGIAQWPAARWSVHVASTESLGVNRWSLKQQVASLLTEMATNPEKFNNATFMGLTDPGQAARVFRQTYFPDVTSDENAARMAERARAWSATLSAVPTTPSSAALTNGILVPCRPAGGAVLDRCPMVPDSFKRSFRSFTGFRWDRLSANTQLMSRCVYTNFPHIQAHGTYSGHMPVWRQAIDFFMPSGCTYRNRRAVTRSRTDLIVGKRLARYLILNTQRLGIDYMIFQDHIRNPDEHAGEGQWRRVSRWRRDNYNNGDCVNTHFDHLHASTYAGGGWAASVRVPGLNPDGKPW